MPYWKLQLPPYIQATHHNLLGKRTWRQREQSSVSLQSVRRGLRTSRVTFSFLETPAKAPSVLGETGGNSVSWPPVLPSPISQEKASDSREIPFLVPAALALTTQGRGTRPSVSSEFLPFVNVFKIDRMTSTARETNHPCLLTARGLLGRAFSAKIKLFMGKLGQLITLSSTAYQQLLPLRAKWSDIYI